MRQLDPKSQWLFFIYSTFAIFVILNFILGLVFTFLFVPKLYYMFYNATSNSILWPLLLIFLAAEIVAFAVSTLVGIAIASYVCKRFKYELLDSGFRKEYSVIWKRDVIIPYERIHSVDITRGIWARILGLSELHIQTAKMRFDNATDYGTDFKEHLIIGITKQEAERLRDELIKRARGSKNQGV